MSARCPYLFIKSSVMNGPTNNNKTTIIYIVVNPGFDLIQRHVVSSWVTWVYDAQDVSTLSRISTQNLHFSGFRTAIIFLVLREKRTCSEYEMKDILLSLIRTVPECPRVRSSMFSLDQIEWSYWPF